MFRRQLKRLLPARDGGATIGKRRCCHMWIAVLQAMPTGATVGSNGAAIGGL
jgi:hypothetical protein